MAEEKPRIFQGAKDITLSLGIIVILMVAMMATSGLCSFNQDRKGQPVTVADAGTFITMESRTTAFPVRLPVVPEDWTCTVARRVQVAEEFAPLLGYVTKDSHYVQLVQSSQPADSIFELIDDKLRERSGNTTIAGHEVEIYTGDEPMWVTTTDDGVTLAVSGLASEEQFAQLMEAALAASPVVINQ
ncbi:MAG: DUF4245 domain-containing protein [Corynebacterium sp.]|nr:DUF4245 domain-containing protein [Corynebacterium sp.]